MKPILTLPALLVLAVSAFLAGRTSAATLEPTPWDPTGFTFELTATVPLAPEEAWDAFTGDVTPWWDHTFFEAPEAMYIEPRVGGGFVEEKNTTDGVLHARVTWAERGKRLVLRGPLGFHGLAADLVHSLVFTPEGDGTRLTVTVNGLGQVKPDEAPIIESVWRHFVHEQWVPWVEAGGPAKR